MLSIVYLAAVIEYLVAELTELSGNAARDHKRKCITPRHLLLAIGNDGEFVSPPEFLSYCLTIYASTDSCNFCQPIE